MKISALSVFPQSFESFLSSPVVSRAIRGGIAEFEAVDIKEYAGGSFRHIDDSPYGGGPGMLLRVDTLKRALDSVRRPESHVVLLSPKGRRFNQQVAHEYASLEHLVLICGHYEGVDARIGRYIDEEVSIGDYILTGGELSAMVISDAVIRLLRGSLRASSTEEESFESGLLEYPQYTHPYEFESECVPDVLLTGNQKEIGAWRLLHSLMDTVRLRPDLLPPDGRIFFYGDFVLKRTAAATYERELSALRFLEGRLPVPAVADTHLSGDYGYILTSRIKGKPLSDPAVIRNRNRLVKSAAAALKTLWLVDIQECPSDRRLRKELAEKRRLVESGSVYLFSSEYSSSQELYEYLSENRMAEDLVFCHGTFDLSDIIVDNNGIAGFTGLSRCGVADRWKDIALCFSRLCEITDISIEEFCSLLGVEPEPEKLHYYTLLARIS